MAHGKTILKGLGKTRVGSLPIDITKLIERTKQTGFADRIKKAVSDDEALEAARLLTQKRKGRLHRYAESGAIGALANPAIRAVGRGVEAAVGAPKGMGAWRGGFARAAMKNVNRGELARQLTEGGLAGGGVQAIREGVELGKAKKTVQRFTTDRIRQISENPG